MFTSNVLSEMLTKNMKDFDVQEVRNESLKAVVAVALPYKKSAVYQISFSSRFATGRRIEEFWNKSEGRLWAKAALFYLFSTIVAMTESTTFATQSRLLFSLAERAWNSNTSKGFVFSVY